MTIDVGITHDQQVAVTITWTKDGSIIVDQRVTVLANGSLYISRVQDSDAGVYKCFVFSQLGNGTTSGRLIVQGMLHLVIDFLFITRRLTFVNDLMRLLLGKYNDSPNDDVMICRRLLL